MNLNEFKQTDWYKERPTIIKEAIDILPPIHLYKFKDTGKQCQIISFEEPESCKIKDVTCTVKKTGVGGVLHNVGLGALDTNEVFGVKLNQLEPWE